MNYNSFATFKEAYDTYADVIYEAIDKTPNILNSIEEYVPSASALRTLKAAACALSNDILHVEIRNNAICFCIPSCEKILAHINLNKEGFSELKDLEMRLEHNAHIYLKYYSEQATKEASIYSRKCSEIIDYAPEFVKEFKDGVTLFFITYCKMKEKDKVSEGEFLERKKFIESIDNKISVFTILWENEHPLKVGDDVLYCSGKNFNTGKIAKASPYGYLVLNPSGKGRPIERTESELTRWGNSSFLNSKEFKELYELRAKLTCKKY